MFVTTGLWSEEYLVEARKFIKPQNIIDCVNTKASVCKTMPNSKKRKIDNKASFLHVYMNETVHDFEKPEKEFLMTFIPKRHVLLDI